MKIDGKSVHFVFFLHLSFCVCILYQRIINRNVSNLLLYLRDDRLIHITCDPILRMYIHPGVSYSILRRPRVSFTSWCVSHIMVMTAGHLSVSNVK